MRLIKQVSLEYREGKSDKVYEVDLCEVASDQFVVNFRYGRRGSTLRDGTKTPAPVAQADAEQIFEKLVASKTDKGYRDTSQPGAVAEPVASAPPAVASDVPDKPADPRRGAVLKRLADGHQSESSWRLSRAVWRAGELRLREAEPLLLNLLGSGDAMLDYSIAWSLAQLGGAQSVPAMRSLQADQNASAAVRRIAAEAIFQLLDGDERQSALEECYRELPEPLASLARSGTADRLAEALNEHLANGDYRAFGVLDILYLIDNEHVRPALLQLLQTAPLRPNYFQRIRHIFKASELRRDSEVFGSIAHRLETSPPMFRNQSRSYYEYSRQQPPTSGPQAEKAFSVQTKAYLRRRIWWTLKRLGELDDPDYVRLAAGVLAAFTDNDAQAARDAVRYDWQAYRASNWRNLQTITTRYDEFATYWAFNHILYGNSPRYEPDPGRQHFSCKPPFVPGGPQTPEREESFPQLWERHPDAVLDLIEQSRCEPVHHFAAKVLRASPEFCSELALESVLMLLRAPYDVTAELGFELAVERYDPQDPDLELVLALANCSVDRARQQAHQWIGEQKQLILKNNELIAALIASPYADTRSFVRDALRQVTLPEADARALIGRLIALLQSLDIEDGPIAADVAETLLRVFGTELRRIGSDVIRDLLGHPLAEVQQFAGDLVLAHDTLASQPPADVLQALLEAEHQAVRGIGVRILGQLPDDVLKNSLDLLVALTRHELQDLRDAIRPTVARLAQSDAEFGRRIAGVLVEALLVPGAPEGVPSHTTRVLREDLRDCLDGISPDVVRNLLQSRSAPAQELGGVLLPTNVKDEDLSVEDIVKLAGHEILSIREAAWKMCTNNVNRLRSDSEAAARLLDAKWEDSRQFAFGFFREHFTDDGALTPNVLVSICDSVRPDVQQFGRQLITRVFEDDHGEEYVLKLSEHPSEAMQLFASNFLERHASDNVDRLRQLAPYFASVLGRVNKGRVAKDRTFRLMESEALKSEAAAGVVAEILARHSATAAIGDKARAIEIMLSIHTAYPSILLPIKVQPVEVRGGV